MTIGDGQNPYCFILTQNTYHDIFLGMDGLIVAMDMMTKFCKRLKYEKKVYILTDACAEINKNEDDVATVQGTLRDGGIQLNVM